MGAFSHIDDHVTAALARRAQEFKKGVKLEALISLLAARTQGIEDVIRDLLTLRLLETATGAQLDNIGRIVGQLRGPATDDQYLLFLRARILANRSNGTVAELKQVLRVARAGVGSREFYGEPYGIPPGFVMRIVDDALNPDSGIVAVDIGGGDHSYTHATGKPGENGWRVDSMLDLLGDARVSGDRGILEWSPVVDEECFRFSTSMMLSVYSNDGEAFVIVDDIYFPPDPSGVGFIAGFGIGDRITLDDVTTLGITDVTFVGAGQWKIWLDDSVSGDRPVGSPVTLCDVDAVDIMPASPVAFETAATLEAAGALQGDSDFVVVENLGSPSTGFVIIDEGLATEERIPYTAFGATGPDWHYTLAWTCMFDHDARAALIVQGTGYENQVGGRLSGALDS